MKILKENPDLKLSINGHTDNLESEAIKEDPENNKLINLFIFPIPPSNSYLNNF